MTYNSRLKTNNTNIQSIIDMANSLPEVNETHGGESDIFPNGTKWTQSNISDVAFYCIYKGNGLWVAGGAQGIYYSVNGKDWIQSNITNGEVYSVFYKNGLYLAYLEELGIYYSADGKIWTKTFECDGIMVTSNIGYANGVYFFENYYSIDGLTWAQHTQRILIETIVEFGNLLVATTANRGIVYSSNGTSWTFVNNYLINGNGSHGIGCADGMLICGIGTNGLCYSTDGKTWTQSNITRGSFSCIHKGNGLWVAGGSRGLYYSTDGKTWSQSNIAECHTNDIYYANGMWVCGNEKGSNNAGLYYSTDGKTWIQSNITNHNTLKCNNIYSADGIWVASRTDGLYYSVTWEQQ